MTRSLVSLSTLGDGSESYQWRPLQGLDRVFIALNYFDFSINQVSTWAMGIHNL